MSEGTRSKIAQIEMFAAITLLVFALLDPAAVSAQTSKAVRAGKGQTYASDPFSELTT